MMTSCANSPTDHMDDVPADNGKVLEFEGEPSLDEMLDDPVVQAVMTQDGVDRQEIVDLVASIQSAFFR